jgi:glycosidase
MTWTSRQRRRAPGAAVIAIAAMMLALSAKAALAGPDPRYQARLPEDEVVYFLLPDRFANGDPSNDRGGLTGDRLKTGFDPTSERFYNGGDLKGVLSRLDYIQGLGATAVWLGPIFKNKPVQGPKGQESAGYHGYWITDFTDVDPHFGARADLKALVDAAHARGMKVYLDIVANHTADVIKYKECEGRSCAYRGKGDYPYTRHLGVDGEAINDGFQGDEDDRQTKENFAKLVRPDYAYTPYIPKGEEHVKRPDWLNDPGWYHNRGETTYKGESATYGDFSGLDDLFTENPRVVQGFIDIYGQWIDDFSIDGFRIDTAKHVNSAFWRAFVPAMQAKAKAKGIDHFHIFGEVADPDPAVLAHYTRTDGYPAVLDFALQAAIADVVAKGEPPARLAHLFLADVNYADGEAGARRLPTFVGNHDMGRFAMMARKADPKATDEDIQRRVILAYAMTFFLRGQPVIYYGDEQGFAGTGDDNAARQSLFASKVAPWNATPLVGTSSTTAVDNYNPEHPIYRALAEMAKVRASDTALRHGDQITRFAAETPGLFAVTRRGDDGTETLIVFNTAKTKIKANIAVDIASRTWRSERGACQPHAAAPGAYAVALAPLDFIVCTTSKP